MRVLFCTDRPLIFDVMGPLLAEAGLHVVGRVPDQITLLMSMAELRPDAVFLMAADATKQPGICSHLLAEYPHVKIVLLSSDDYAIADVGIRVRKYDGVSAQAIHDSLVTLLAETS